MKVLIFGAGGMLGHKLVQVLSPRFDVSCTLRDAFDKYESFGLFDREQVIENVDITDLDSVQRAIERTRPDVVINAVGVIKQLPQSSDVISSLGINAIFPNQLARLGEQYGFRLVAVSTDCVFSGSRGMYTEDDVPDARDLYGQSKHWGEVDSENCLTIRTSIIGRELQSDHGLIEWFIKHRGGFVKGYSKAVFSGFPTLVLADILVDIISEHRKLSGVFHVSSEPINKFELLTKVNTRMGLNIEVIEDDEFVIDRSLDSTHYRNATGFTPPTWDEMIDVMANDPTPYDSWK
jgi:dTDP-4-dehydrorhamnose reductase